MNTYAEMSATEPANVPMIRLVNAEKMKKNNKENKVVMCNLMVA
jgi:hypothetical protein